MDYYTISLLSRDSDIIARATACAVLEGEPSPESWVFNNRWQLAASPGWSEAYKYALDTSMENPGRGSSVISDGQILAAVQALQEAQKNLLPDVSG